MPREAEADQAAELVALLRAHDLPADGLVGHAVGVGTGLGIFRKVPVILGHGVVEQRQAVVEDWRRAEDLPAAIVSQDAEIAEMPILVVDHRVEHQHAFQLLGSLLADPLIEIQTGLNAAAFHDPPDGDIGGVDIGEELALGGQNILPVLQIVMDGVQPHALGDLTGVELTVRLTAGVGRALRAALVEIDPVALNKAPRFPKHTLCGQLRRGGEGLVTLPHAGIGHQRQDAGKAVFVEIVFLERTLKAKRNDPIAVVQGQALADVDDALGVVDAQTQRLQNLVHEGAVFGDHALFQPLHHAVVREIEVKRKHFPAILVHREHVRFHTGETRVLEGEGQELFVIEPQAVFVHDRFAPFLQT